MTDPRIYVTRHGQSRTNADKVLVLDHDENGLTEVGRSQAVLYGYRLWVQRVRITHAYVSPLKRATETLAIIMGQLGAPPHFQSVCEELREIDWRRDEGQDELVSTRGLPIDAKPLIIPAKRLLSTESQRDVFDRVIGKFTEIADAHNYSSISGDVLIVTHHFPIKAILSFVRDGTPDHMNEFSPDNLCELSFSLDEVATRARAYRRERTRA